MEGVITLSIPLLSMRQPFTGHEWGPLSFTGNRKCRQMTLNFKTVELGWIFSDGAGQNLRSSAGLETPKYNL